MLIALRMPEHSVPVVSILLGAITANEDLCTVMPTHPLAIAHAPTIVAAGILAILGLIG